MDFLRDEDLLNKQGEMVAAEEALKNIVVVIYFFSAAWCQIPSCIEILQLLKTLHQENLRRRSGFQVIFVSSDHDDTSYKKYFSNHGDWYAIPYNNSLSEELRQTYSITAIPTIIVVKTSGEIITKTGTTELHEKGINVLVTWAD